MIEYRHMGGEGLKLLKTAYDTWTFPCFAFTYAHTAAKLYVWIMLDGRHIMLHCMAAGCALLVYWLNARLAC